VATGDPQADEFDRRLARREATLREEVAALTRRVSDADAAVEDTALETLAALRRELDCIVAARRAVATLRPCAARDVLPAHRRG
jgi:hypothetical protein